ncbi:DNA polymerase III subunit chi [Pseudogemmobacter sonorensis]|uniref:DNA polymerase III subunit chi n=1 Tax=Pseudogemmobacter sonorensis TaxID=2989681 RepID=UPI0036BDC3FE
MGAVKFYQLGQTALEDAVRPLLEGALAQGWPVSLRGPDRAALALLDERLWLSPANGFLPHGVEGGPHDARQPVLIGAGAASGAPMATPTPANDPRAVLLLGGAQVDPDESRRMERVWLLFEARDPAQLEAARAEWRAVCAAGLVAEFWSDASGRWEKKAQSGS